MRRHLQRKPFDAEGRDFVMYRKYTCNHTNQSLNKAA